MIKRMRKGAGTEREREGGGGIRPNAGLISPLSSSSSFLFPTRPSHVLH